MPEENLHSAKLILLRRCPNGWTVKDDEKRSDAPFVFESTESLSKAMVCLIGKSGWKVEAKKVKPPVTG